MNTARARIRIVIEELVVAGLVGAVLAGVAYAFGLNHRSYVEVPIIIVAITVSERWSKWRKRRRLASA